MDNTAELAVLSLCTGYGGLEFGLAGALANPVRVVAVEIEAYALANLVAKAEEGKLAIDAMWPDLRTFPAQRFRGCFAFVVAGYPCQPHSIAGPQSGRDHAKYLWLTIARIIDAVCLDFVFLENVPNHLRIGFDEVLADLERMGFIITPGLYSAAETGASMRSRRLFVLAEAVRDGHQRAQTEICARWQEPIDGVPGAGPPGPAQVGEIPRMADDGPFRVDRLRLLGNGVVPRQAAKALRALITAQKQENEQ